MTTIYILRHSQSFGNLFGEYNVNADAQLRNEKNPLSVDGERLAKEMSERDELQNIDAIYSSHYVRTMCTAKYIAENNNIMLNVEERLGERKFGVNKMSDIPSDFFEKQFKDWNYKLENGESLNEVANRMYEVFIDILNKNKGKNIVIVSHGSALSTLFSKLCNINYNENTRLLEIHFNNELIFDGKWNAPELFKLVLNDNNEVIEINNIK